jgi:phosphonopyruvate decarboxylase
MKPIELIREFKRYRLGPYIEVPCSFLEPLLEALARDSECEVVNPANEAIAMGMATGSFLATGKIPVVLMQNSGLCNTLNAFTSLNQIYKIPLLCLIAWRGQPGIKDAPEHTIMGPKLKSILETFDIPYEVLSTKSYKREIKSVINTITASMKPAALLVTEDLLKGGKIEVKNKRSGSGLSRAAAVNAIIAGTAGKAYYVSTNGFLSRETCYVLEANGLEKVNQCFYMMGSMGHALPIALGVERYLKDGRKTVVIDGDGGCLMHLGAMASVNGKNHTAANLIHIVLDNGVYASTGGQPSVSGDIDFLKIAHGCGYKNVYSVREAPSLARIMTRLLSHKGPSFIHVQIDDIGEPPKPRVSDKHSCEAIKQSFMDTIKPSRQTRRLRHK